MAFMNQPHYAHTYVHVINYKSPRDNKQPKSLSHQVENTQNSHHVLGSKPTKNALPVPVQLFQSRADERTKAVSNFLDRLAGDGHIPLPDVRDTRDSVVAIDRKELRQQRVPVATKAVVQKVNGNVDPNNIKVGGQKVPGKKIWVIKKKREKSLPVAPANTPQGHNVLHVYLPRTGTQGTL